MSDRTSHAHLQDVSPSTGIVVTESAGGAPTDDGPAVGNDRIAELIVFIRKANKAAVLAAGSVLDHAIAAGEALNELKKIIPYGWWLAHLAKCGVGADRAERYMQLARGRAKLEADSARMRNLSLTAALRILKPEPTEPEPVPVKADAPAAEPESASEFSNPPSDTGDKRHGPRRAREDNSDDATEQSWQRRRDAAFVENAELVAKIADLKKQLAAQAQTQRELEKARREIENYKIETDDLVKKLEVARAAAGPEAERPCASALVAALEAEILPLTQSADSLPLDRKARTRAQKARAVLNAQLPHIRKAVADLERTQLSVGADPRAPAGPKSGKHLN